MPKISYNIFQRIKFIVCRFKFSRKFRILKKKCFINIFKNSKKIEIYNVLLLYRINNLKYPRIGILISKKYSKLSHERNKIKRVIRESFRLNRKKLPNLDFLFIFKHKKLIDNSNLLNKLRDIWLFYFLSF